MRIVSGAATATGRVREGNEDSYLVDRRLQLFAVADGMGGHRAGEVASATALEGLRLAVDSGSEIGDAVGRANSAVWDKASADTQLAGMGTTLTAAWSDGTTLTVAHVGDSRAYLLRGDTLQRVTVDHSLVEELIRDGRLTEEQAAVHPQRSIITRALGIDSSVAVDVYSLVLQANDRVMICSDGLTSMVRAVGIAEILRRESDPTAAANALVDAANEAGG
ncbi:MAG: Stp1/IreP family PP2C-type Ser/Thr phosphatase, partial [Acidimicrobiia bacterium]